MEYFEMELIKLEFNQSFQHSRFLEEQSMNWLKYHFTFFPIVIIILGWLFETSSNTFLLKPIAIILIFITLLVGLCNLYNQTTARIGYVFYGNNVNSIYNKFPTDSHISKEIKNHSFWKGDTMRHFYIWDFWSARAILISIINAITLLSLINVIYLDYEIKSGEFTLKYNININISIIIAITFAVFQFFIYFIVLKKFDNKQDKT